MMGSKKRLLEIRANKVPSISGQLKYVFMKDNFVDVTLVSDDQESFQAHKIVLSSFSPVLKDLLLSNSHPHPIIFLRGVKTANLWLILQFIYNGYVELTSNDLEDLLNTVKDLKLETLEKALSKEANFNPVQHDFKAQDAEKVEIINEENGNEVEAIADTKKSNIDNKEVVTLERDVHSCDKCESSFSYKSSMTAHMKSTHEGIEYFCNQCEYKTGNKRNVKIHKASVHDGVRYFCDACAFQATHQAVLKRHQESVHEGIRYSCTDCVYNARRPDHLKRHQRVKHRKEI